MGRILIVTLAMWGQASGEPDVAPVLARLQDKDAGTRLKAAAALASWPTELEPRALSALAKALGDVDPRVRKSVVQTLGEAGPRSREWAGGPELSARLATLFQDKDTSIKRLAIWAYGQVGLDELDELQPLVDVLVKNPSPEVRGQVLTSLAQYVHDQAPEDWRRQVVEKMLPGLSDRDARVQRLTGQLLVGCGADAVGPLTSYLDTSKGRPRLWAAAVLGEIGPAARSALPSLRKALSEVSREGRPEVEFAIRKIGG